MKKCAFCANPADSREHIWSDWMIRMLPAKERFKFTELLNNGEYATWEGRKIQNKAQVVCTTCNNRWMNELEDKHAKVAMHELLLGNNTASLDLRSLTAMTAYAFKTTVVANHKDLKTRSPFFTNAQRFQFRNSLQVPRGIQVWLACHKSQHLTGKFDARYGKFDRETADTFSYYVCTWTFCNIVLQLVAPQWDDQRLRNTLPFPTIPQADYWSEASILIWPLPVSDVVWPPRKYLSDDTIKAFINRWNSFDAVTAKHVITHKTFPPKS